MTLIITLYYINSSRMDPNGIRTKYCRNITEVYIYKKSSPNHIVKDLIMNVIFLFHKSPSRITS